MRVRSQRIPGRASPCKRLARHALPGMLTSAARLRDSNSGGGVKVCAGCRLRLERSGEWFARQKTENYLTVRFWTLD
jgi:hypothetical protein